MKQAETFGSLGLFFCRGTRETSKFLINCGEDIGVWAGCEEDDVINLNVSIDTLLLLFASNILRSVLLRTE